MSTGLQRSLVGSHKILVRGRRHIFSLPPDQLPNTGSTARDVLAAERTFLAWARTGLGFVGAGSALSAAYYRQQDAASTASILPAAGLLIGNGAFLLIFATHRYAMVLNALATEVFPVYPRSTLFAIGTTSANTLIALGIIWKAESSKRHQVDSESN